MSNPIRFTPDMGWPHVSRDSSRGYVEYDPILRLSNDKKIEGEHGLMDIRAEVARSAYSAGMLDTPLIREILKKP